MGSSFKAAWEAAVADYDSFDGTCDDVMDDFEMTKEDAKAVYDDAEEFFEHIRNGATDVEDVIRAAIEKFESDYEEDARDAFQTVQEWITSLRNYVRYYQERTA